MNPRQKSSSSLWEGLPAGQERMWPFSFHLKVWSKETNIYWDVYLRTSWWEEEHGWYQRNAHSCHNLWKQCLWLIRLSMTSTIHSMFVIYFFIYYSFLCSSEWFITCNEPKIISAWQKNWYKLICRTLLGKAPNSLLNLFFSINASSTMWCFLEPGHSKDVISLWEALVVQMFSSWQLSGTHYKRIKANISIFSSF